MGGSWAKDRQAATHGGPIGRPPTLECKEPRSEDRIGHAQAWRHAGCGRRSRSRPGKQVHDRRVSIQRRTAIARAAHAPNKNTRAQARVSGDFLITSCLGASVPPCLPRSSRGEAEVVGVVTGGAAAGVRAEADGDGLGEIRLEADALGLDGIQSAAIERGIGGEILIIEELVGGGADLREGAGCIIRVFAPDTKECCIRDAAVPLEFDAAGIEKAGTKIRGRGGGADGRGRGGRGDHGRRVERGVVRGEGLGTDRLDEIGPQIHERPHRIVLVDGRGLRGVARALRRIEVGPRLRRERGQIGDVCGAQTKAA